MTDSVKWDQLDSDQRKMLFDRLQKRIESRAGEAREWRQFFLKGMVTVNAAAIAGIFAFIANLYQKTDQLTANQASMVKWGLISEGLFVSGFLLASVGIALVYTQTREALIKENRYLSEVLSGDDVVD